MSDTLVHLINNVNGDHKTVCGLPVLHDIDFIGADDSLIWARETRKCPDCKHIAETRGVVIHWCYNWWVVRLTGSDGSVTPLYKGIGTGMIALQQNAIEWLKNNT